MKNKIPPFYELIDRLITQVQKPTWLQIKNNNNQLN